MTLLSISTDVADEVQGPRPTTIIGNTDPDAQKMLRLVNKAGTRIMLAYPWQILRKERTFTSNAAEEQTGALPTDFNRFISETFWDRSTNNLISGPITPVEWNGLKVQAYASQNKKFIYRGGSIFTSPSLDAGVSCAFEYISKNWCNVAAANAPKAKFTIDTDIGIIDEELITYAVKFEYLKDAGLPWENARQDLQDQLDILTENEIASPGVSAVADIFAQNSRHFDGAPKASRASYGGDF
jgi:hypothetical protein